jgi:hypothetical protein
MKSLPFLCIIVLFAALGTLASAQEPTKPASAKPTPSAADLESKLITTLTNATLTGRACGIKDGQLGPDKEDSYTVVSIAKVSGDNWTITARLSYNGASIDLPIPTKVQWAGDAPVLILDDIGFGGPRTYSARVLIYDNAYAGTWSAKDHGGLVNGVITHGTK